MQSTPFMGTMNHRPPGAPPMRGGRTRSAMAGKQMVHGSGGTLHVSFYVIISSKLFTSYSVLKFFLFQVDVIAYFSP